MSRFPSLRALDSALAGDVVEPSHERFAETRHAFYGEYERHEPHAIAQVADASDVARVVVFAQDHALPLAIKAGGHSILGHSSPKAAMVIDLSRLKGLDIEVEDRTAWAGGGLLAGEYTTEVAKHGLVTGFGDTPTVGITGLTLGGGVGFLHRKLGLTLDSVLGAEIVTADDEVRLIDEEHDPDLFWAIRGGGGNFGVITRLHYRLHPLGDVLGGMIILPATPRVVTDFVDLTREASDDLSVIGGVAMAPPLPFLPEEVHGQLVILGLMVHAGDPDTAELEVGRFRKLATPLVDTLQVMPYPAMFEGEAGPPQPYAIAGRSFFTDDLTVEDAEAGIDGLRTSSAPMSVIQVRVLGGAVARVPNDATAFAHRSRPMILNVASAFEEPGQRPEHEAWVTALRERLQRGERGANPNFHGDDSVEAVREIYPGETWERLVEVKTKYDRDNVFAMNHNIPPRS